MSFIRLLLFTILTVAANCASAYDVQQDGLFFNITSMDECEIAKGKDTESVEVPRDIFYNNHRYNVTRIGAGAFSDCSSLVRITIPETVSSIEENAFHGCMMLEGITIPQGVTSIGDGAFAYCVSLQAIAIPAGVTRIGKETFAYCCGLRTMTIPESVKSIGQGAFDDCTSLERVNFPKGGMRIESMAFPWCFSLKNIAIPEGTKTIDEATFFGCSALESIAIPQSIESIGFSAFSECKNVKQIVSSAAEPPALGDEQYQVFPEMLYSTAKVIVPTNSLEAYRQAREWKNFKNLEGGAEELAGIEGITVDNEANGKIKIYDIQGNRLKDKSKGINIISRPDGKTHKTVVK